MVDGAITQGLRKKLLPTLKSRRRLGDKLAEGREKALWSRLNTVPLPAERASPGSAWVKRGDWSQATRPNARAGINRGSRRRNGTNIGTDPRQEIRRAILAG
ncbi:hypothetical protein D9M68_880320 [compost metagenome]